MSWPVQLTTNVAESQHDNLSFCSRDFPYRNGRLEEQLTAPNELSNRIAAENVQLHRDASERERENFEVAEYLRKDLADRKRELAELRDAKQEVRQLIGNRSRLALLESMSGGTEFVCVSP